MKHQYRYHPLLSALIAAGLCGMSGMALATGVTAPTTSSSISVGEVSSTTGALNTLAHLPTKKQVFNSTQSVKVINKRQMATAGPVGGAAQALAVAPGINVATDGPSGAPRSSISINGIEPFAYLCDVLEKLPTWPNKKLHELLPWNWKKSALA